MNASEELRKFARIAGIPESSVDEKSDLIGFFQYFRPFGDKLNEVFEGAVRGDEVMERVLKCFSATSQSSNGPYFISVGHDATQSDVTTLIRNHFQDLRSIAEIMGDNELNNILSAITLRYVSESEFEQLMPGDDAPDAWIFDLVTDYMTTLTPVDTSLLLLKDAVYSMANDIFLQQYILWPIYRESATLDDPFQSYFELWSTGIQFQIPDASTCLVRHP